MKAIFLKRFQMLCVAILFATTQISYAEPVEFGKRAKLLKHSKIKLSRAALSKYRIWKSRGSYFGAFVYNPVSGGAYYAHSFNDLEVARALTMWACKNDKEGKEPESCILFASYLPKSLPNNTKQAFGVGGAYYPVYRQFLKNPPASGKYTAFAISRLNGGAATFSQASLREAKEIAIKGCKANTSVAIANGLAPVEAKRYLKKQNWHRCEVVHVLRGGD